MKKLLFILLAVFVVGGMGCKKDTENNDPGTGSTMSLKVDGTSWNASLSVQAVNSNGVINITGSDSNAHQASVILSGVTATGTYQVGPGGNPGNILRWTEGLGQNDSYQANNVIGAGTVTLTELTDTKIVGTFQFEGYNTGQSSKTITEGSFSANL